MTLKKGNIMTNTVERIIRKNAPSTIDRIEVLYVNNDFACISYDIGDLKNAKMVIDLELNPEELHDFMIEESTQALSQYIKFDEYFNHRNR